MKENSELHVEVDRLTEELRNALDENRYMKGVIEQLKKDVERHTAEAMKTKKSTKKQRRRNGCGVKRN